MPDDVPRRPTVRRRVVVAAPPERVWRTVTDPRELSEWIGGAVTGPGRALRRPGDEAVLDPAEGPPRRLRVTEVVEPRRFAFDWWRDDGDPDAADRSSVEIDLLPAGEGTRVEVTETRAAAVPAHDVPAAPDVDGFAPGAGWYTPTTGIHGGLVADRHWPAPTSGTGGAAFYDREPVAATR